MLFDFEIWTLFIIQNSKPMETIVHPVPRVTHPTIRIIENPTSTKISLTTKFTLINSTIGKMMLTVSYRDKIIIVFVLIFRFIFL